jgi:hypothetical protein
MLDGGHVEVQMAYHTASVDVADTVGASKSSQIASGMAASRTTPGPPARARCYDALCQNTESASQLLATRGRRPKIGPQGDLRTLSTAPRAS